MGGLAIARVPYRIDDPAIASLGRAMLAIESR
jgi:hypothetical protein